MSALENDEYEVPLLDQRYFGAGIKRKRIKFVPSSSATEIVQSLPTTPSQSAAEIYLSIVLKKRQPAERSASAPPAELASAGEDEAASNHAEAAGTPAAKLCEVCKRPIKPDDTVSLHESSITHQICLEHSHPPSHVDRRRKGLAVLESQGWDPDSRKGLGQDGEGILYPIKAKDNPNRAGLGAKFKDLQAVEKPVKLDAGKVRLMEMEGKKKAQKLRDAFYRSEDVEKYLGGEGQTNPTLDLNAIKRARRR